MHQLAAHLGPGSCMAADNIAFNSGGSSGQHSEYRTQQFGILHASDSQRYLCELQAKHTDLLRFRPSQPG